MHALVLAAGVGSRLRPITDDRPKPMLLIDGHPIVGYNLAILAASGFTDVVINLHYLPNVVRAYVGDGSRWGLRVSYSEEKELRGTAGALVPLKQQFSGGTFAVVFGDNLAEINLDDMLVQHRANAAVVTIALWERDDITQSGVAEIDRSGRIKRFIEKPNAGETSSHWVNAGIFLAQPELFDAIPSEGASDLGCQAVPALIAAGQRIDGYCMTGGLWWFDRIAEYEAARDDARLRQFVRSLRGGHDGVRVAW